MKKSQPTGSTGATIHSISSSPRQSQPTEPEEDRRAQYERVAEALSTLCEVEFGPNLEGADIADLKERPMMKGIERHMQEIFRRADFSDPRTIRRFYVELRMWGDRLTAEQDEMPLPDDE